MTDYDTCDICGHYVCEHRPYEGSVCPECNRIAGAFRAGHVVGCKYARQHPMTEAERAEYEADRERMEGEMLSPPDHQAKP